MTSETTVRPELKLNITEILESAQLPALPQTAIALLELSQDASNGPQEFARPIEADPGLMGQILKFVNSSYFGFSREISSIKQALALVGVRTIKNFALWSAVFSLVPDPKFGPFKLQMLWQDSLRRAVFARHIGKAIKLSNAEDLFAAALLQDMAIPLLLKELPEHYESLIARRTLEKVRLSTLERELFGWDHADAAAALARSWGLPEVFATLIERHSNFEVLVDSKPPALDAACVALAALLPSCQDEQWSEHPEFLRGLKRLSASSYDSLRTIIADTDKVFAEFAPVMKLPVPDRSLSDWLDV
ncbi:HDOD domain-containing protein [Aureliella helgolandensis]|uniref:HDOD domain protein n=1 Tax=Aureliella helgolandensis TaxID=2527968 RepID=A0A518G0Q9_9BACT|nr:HDOD domain-containing protein [Aureliella helgolandensis]QDV22195.1 HDOD domain protein [Aureliella helgolandensis]